jgi:hypothetical protein
MGIQNLMKVIGDHAANAIHEYEMKHYFGRKIAIDASMSLYQFLIAIRQDGAQLQTESGETTRYFMGGGVDVSTTGGVYPLTNPAKRSKIETNSALECPDWFH